eukprot:gene14803-biopygen20134
MWNVKHVKLRSGEGKGVPGGPPTLRSLHPCMLPSRPTPLRATTERGSSARRRRRHAGHWPPPRGPQPACGTLGGSAQCPGSTRGQPGIDPRRCIRNAGTARPQRNSTSRTRYICHYNNLACRSSSNMDAYEWHGWHLRMGIYNLHAARMSSITT